MTRSLSSPQLSSFLELMASLLAPYLKKEFHDSDPSQEFYSQKNSPLGRRMHLELVRSGDLKGSKVGKLILVPRIELHAYIEAHEIPPRSSSDDDTVEHDDPLDDWGLERGTK